MGALRHMKNRVLQTVVDVPARGVSAVGHTFTADARSVRQTEINNHLTEKRAEKLERSIVMAAAVQEYHLKQARAKAEADAKVAELLAKRAEQKSQLMAAAEYALAKTRVLIEMKAEETRAAADKAAAEAEANALMNAAQQAEFESRVQAELAARRIEAEDRAKWAAKEAKRKAAEAKKSVDDEAFRKIEMKRQLRDQLDAEIAEDTSALRAKSSLSSSSPSKAADKPAPAPTKGASAKSKTEDSEQVEA
jgi:hypothetical protein